MPVSDFHGQVAAIALRAAASHGFALGGGNALIAHGVIDRFTQDVDVFSDEEGGVEAAADAVEAALLDAGFGTERRDKAGGLGDIFHGIGEGLAEWIVTAPGGEQMMLQMAYFDRARRPVTMGVGPVLDLEDVVGGKVCALASRVEPRDYVDTAAALERYSVEQIVGFARRLDPGLTDRDFADAVQRLDQWGDGVFASFGLGPEDVAELRARFAAWPRSLSSGRAPPLGPVPGAGDYVLSDTPEVVVMTGETMRDLLKPLIGKSGQVSMLVRRIGPVSFPMAENKKLTGVEVRRDGLVRIERQTGWAIIDPDDVVAVVWNDDSDSTPGQFL